MGNNDNNHHVIEPDQHNQNSVEWVIRELRRKWFRVMVRKRVSRRLGDYGFRWVADIMQLNLTQTGGLNGRCPLERVSSKTPDISEYLDFGFYDRCWYYDNVGLSPALIGRCLGVSHRTISGMSYWILMKTSIVISRTTVQRVTSLGL